MRRRLPWIVGLTGLALVVAGVALFAAGATAAPGAAGWFAYEPLPLERAHEGRLPLAFDDGSVLWSVRQLTGAALVVAGLLPVAGLAGWAVGRRLRGAGPEGP